MHHLLLGTLAFFLTFAETIVSTWEGRADRQATACRDNRFSKKSAHWAAVFETLLLVDVVLVVQEPVLYAPPIIAAAWIGKYWAVEQRRKKFRRRTKRSAKATVSRAPRVERSDAGKNDGASAGACGSHPEREGGEARS